MNRFGCIILAAGASRRMGRLKQLLPLEGKALVIRAAEAALESAAWPVVIVLGARAEEIRPGLARLPVLAVDNPTWTEGMASSIRAGLAALQEFSRAIDGAVIALCDQPAFSSAIIEKLRAVQRESASSIVAAHYGGRRGAPALFLREHFATLSALSGDEGARSLLNDTPGRVATVDLPDLAVDLDTPDDYAAVKNGFSPL